MDKVDNINTNNDNRQVIIVDTLKEHQSKAGKVGGKSKSEAKMRAMRLNLAKANMNRRRRVPRVIYNDKIDQSGNI